MIHFPLWGRKSNTYQQQGGAVMRMVWRSQGNVLTFEHLNQKEWFRFANHFRPLMKTDEGYVDSDGVTFGTNLSEDVDRYTVVRIVVDLEESTSEELVWVDRE
jgi:hypothetical protein